MPIEPLSENENIVAETHRYFQGLFVKKKQELAGEKKSKPGLISYAPAFTLALLKDLLDLVGVGSIPAIGTIVTICFSLLIFLVLMLARTNKKLRGGRFVLKRALVLLCGTMVEGFIFGLNFLPIETFTVGLIYWMDRRWSNKQIDVLFNALKALEGDYKGAMRGARRDQNNAEAAYTASQEEQAEAEQQEMAQQEAANEDVFQSNSVRKVV